MFCGYFFGVELFINRRGGSSKKLRDAQKESISAHKARGGGKIVSRGKWGTQWRTGRAMKINTVIKLMSILRFIINFLLFALNCGAKSFRNIFCGYLL